jgi:hypothetical protein
LQIIHPSAGGPVGDGNLLLVEATAVDPVDGMVDRVEVAFDGDERWQAAERDPADPTRWRYLWSDPPPGDHRIRVRAAGLAGPVDAGQADAEQSTTVTVADVWSQAYIIDNPYAVPGPFRKGQLHTHSTASFDGWNSLAPRELALAYKARGYAFVVLTDHDLVSDASAVNDPSFLALPGFESTADSGHITGLLTPEAVAPALSPQERINGITVAGGLAVLDHPGWRIGWSAKDFEDLAGYTAIEIFNGGTSDLVQSPPANLAKWQTALGAKGWSDRIWAVAVDDAHSPEQIDRGWVMVKSPELTGAAIKQALRTGAFYASNGPSFRTLGVLEGTIVAASPEAASLRFVDQEGIVRHEGPGVWGGYRPTGKERWIRVEAVMADGRTAWSQPFWLMPNAPRVALDVGVDAAGDAGALGLTLRGETLPGARVHLSDRGQYLGSVVADEAGAFGFGLSSLAEGEPELWILATAPWPDHLAGPPTLLQWAPARGPSVTQSHGPWTRGSPVGRRPPAPRGQPRGSPVPA